MAYEKPKLLFRAKVERKRYFRRFMWLVLGAVGAGGAVAALSIAAERDLIDEDVLSIGQIVGAAVVVLLIIRALLNLWRWLTTRNERLQIFDRGFVWERGGKQHKYSWAQLRTFREGLREIHLLGRPVFQRGAHSLTMRDGKTFRIKGIHGDTRRFVKAVRPYIADVTGTRMAQALRNGKSVRVHPQLVVSSGGLIAGKHKITWDKADVRVRRGRLSVCRLNKEGKFKTVQSYGTHTIDNLGGFLELATSTIKNHQPERFNIQTAGG